MKKIGYIYSEKKINNIPKYIGVVNELSLIDDPNMPLLIVGYYKAKERIEDFKSCILTRKVNEKLFWTFSKTEKREVYEKDLEEFIRHCFNLLIGDLKYFYVNPFKLTYTKTKKILNILNYSEQKYIYISNDMLYLYHNSNVFGFSLKILEYCGISKEKILNRLKNNKSFTIKYENMVEHDIRQIISNKKYVMAYLVSIFIT